MLANHKLVHGVPLGILGLNVSVNIDGFRAAPLADKVVKWSQTISSALTSGKLCPGAARKLVGALAWASSHMFRRLGRALLRRVHSHCAIVFAGQ